MTTNKKTQYMMIWLLPLIVIGGLFWPLLGYIVLFMMIFFLILSYFKGRFWCANLCPRGAFLDIALSKFSLKKKIPNLLTSSGFKMFILVSFIIFFIFQLISADKNLFAIGFVFVRMCLLTTIVSIVLGIPIHQRTWCSFCPMGTLQTKIHLLKKTHGPLDK